MAYEIKYRSEDEMKDSGIKWLGKVPDEWGIKKLKHAYNFNTGATPPSGDDSYYDECGYKWVTISDINNRYIDNTKNRISNKAIKNINFSLNKRGSMVYSFKLSVGHVAFLNDDMYTNEAIATFGINNINSLDYLYYMAPIFIIKNSSTNIYGAKLLNQDLINNAKILMPGLIDQQKIANFLDIKTSEFDSIISKKQQLIEKLEEAKKSLISEVITGKVKIVDGQLVDRKPEEMKDSGVEWLGMIPKDWELSKLKYVSNIIMGQSPNSDDINQEGIGIPFLQGKAEFGYKNPKAINFCNKPKKMSRVNDILISVRAPVGDLNISDNVYCIGRGLASIGSNRSNKYLYYTLLTYKDVLKSIATGSTFEAITIEQLKNVIMLNPDDLDQQKTANFLDIKASEFNSIITKTQKQITKLKEAKQSLISEAVTGKIDLRDWEIIETGGR